MVTIFSCEATPPEAEEAFRSDFGVLLPKSDTDADELVLTDDGMDVLLLARDLAELRLADLGP
jgi:hypothetical protein